MIGVVIPTYNEEEHIPKLLHSLKSVGFKNIVVVDAGSSDRTKEVSDIFDDVVVVESSQKGRAMQMNFGSRLLDTEYLLFLHADVQLPSNFYQQISKEVDHREFDLANFQMKFDSKHWFLKLNAPFSKTSWIPFQFGDQGLLIKTRLFKESKGFNDSLIFMEGNEIIRRLKKSHQFQKLPITITVSDRKYKKHGVFRLQFSYYLIYLFDRIGLSQLRIRQLFYRILK